MSYMLDEGIADTERSLSRLQEIAKEFPDASLTQLANGESVWTSEKALGRADKIRFVRADTETNFYVCPYVELSLGGRVYVRQWHWVAGYEWQSRIERNPELYKQLVALVAGIGF